MVCYCLVSKIFVSNSQGLDYFARVLGKHKYTVAELEQVENDVLMLLKDRTTGHASLFYHVLEINPGVTLAVQAEILELASLILISEHYDRFNGPLALAHAATAYRRREASPIVDELKEVLAAIRRKFHNCLFLTRKAEWAFDLLDEN